MILLILGVALFALLHLVPVFAKETRRSVVSRVGAMPYKGLFALATVGAFYLIYRGWTLAIPTQIYTPPSWGIHLTALLVLFGFILFFASRAPTNIKRYIRHPQLMGLSLWALGHLIANGDSRSVVLFLGMGLWAQIAIFGLNIRDGEWKKPVLQPIGKDIITVLIGVILYAIFAIWAHDFLFGVKPFP